MAPFMAPTKGVLVRAQSMSYSYSSEHSSAGSAGGSSHTMSLNSGAVDVTGNTYSCGLGGLSQAVGEGAELLDDAIISMISYQNDPVVQLRAVLRDDPQCGLASCLLVLELLRNPPASASAGVNAANYDGASSAAAVSEADDSTAAESEAAADVAGAGAGGPATKAVAVGGSKGNPDHQPTESHTVHAARPGEIAALLLQLERDFTLLNDREQRYAAAALAWSRGLFYECAALLESVVQSSSISDTDTSSNRGHGASGGDALALRLAQEAYLVAGDSQNVLSCVSRSLQTLDDTHFLHGHIMGMQASGYMQGGKWVDAEGLCARAVERTKGRDVSSLHTLLSIMQLQGRSSEIMASLDNHEENHKGAGLHMLLFNKGSSHVQRGNYRGALKMYDHMLDLMKYRSDDDNNHRTATNATHATLLLWTICLNAPATHEAHKRWSEPDLPLLWSQIDLAEHTHALMYDVAKMMCYSAAASLVPSVQAAADAADAYDGADADTSDSSGSVVSISEENKSAFIDGGEEWDASYTREYSSSSIKPSDDADANGSAAANAEVAKRKPAGTGVIEGLYAYLTGQGEGNGSSDPEQDEANKKAGILMSDVDKEEVERSRRGFLALDVTDLLARHMQHMHHCASASATTNEQQQQFPRLEGVQSGFPLEPRSPELQAAGSATNVSDKQWQLASCGNDISQALLAYCHADYDRAVKTLKATSTAVSRLGGSSAQQDVIKQTLVEACLRSNRLLEARLLLCERTALAPNEAQSWRRLASVFGRMGNQQLAEAAHYTSWQLGIAQGGFGGAR